MKVAPTIEGGLRIDPESEEDWDILRSIAADANSQGIDLASRLGGLVTDEKLAEDWQDIVVPDLRESFMDDLDHIQASIETAAAFPKDGKSHIWITREDAFAWYSALNQARLALEEKYHFSSDPEQELGKIAPQRRNALIRTQLYQDLQSVILTHSLTL